MKEKYSYLIKNIGLFFLAGFLPRVLSFFMVPLYTSCLSTADYGTVDLLTNVVQLVLPILTLQVQDAVMRYAMDNRYDKCDVFGVGITISFIGGAVLIVGCICLKMLDVFPLNWIYLLFIIISYFLGALNNIFSYFCRGINEIKILTVSSVVAIVINICCNLLFLLVLNLGIFGYLMANSIGSAASVLLLFFGARLFLYVRIGFADSVFRKEMIYFSIPMIFSALSWWINDSLDKFVLTFFCGVSATGVLAVAYKIPTILSVLGNVIAKAFSISAIKEFDSQDSDHFLGNSYSAISFGMVACCSIIMVFNIPLAQLLFAKDFYVAWKFVPPLLIAACMSQLSLACEHIFVAIKETKIIAHTAMVGAMINSAGNFLFIPKLGGYGAALATAVGFTLVWAIRYNIMIKYIRIKNNLPKELATYLLLIVQMMLAYYGNRFLGIQMIILGCLFVLYRRELQDLTRKLFVRLFSLGRHISNP
ncbi:oligosaccharide flippase family protein [Desulfosporosinus meridiei]|uniref:Membrane protein involved in the export of O-antigen and teichoic acid n=1 Tax=Desulfosporosinus meridiei (strain ATCC BAA-275 / DSM 13257 / KCTC 12902 / NCIMB 13706 / S10) TaxID=768704 RepID=J7J0U3_DESMD|nr:oligosaccharide flippase family protein [Desulfosporosinus meridiei]AFQ45979.1 membrane protein involved in the export of O-antigen and teichoic acid [Desulfosporosinus meridiei DSM 13257]